MYYDRLRRQVRTAKARREAIDRGPEDIEEHIAPVYSDLFNDVEQCGHEFYNLTGGRASGKSSFVALVIVDAITKDTTGEFNAIIFRKTAATLRDSVFSQFQWAINELNVSALWSTSVSPLKCTYTPTGAEVFFRGLDDPAKIKSIKPKKGFFRYVWFEEYSELPGRNFERTVLQSVVRGGQASTVFRTYNPPISQSNWCNVAANEPDDRVYQLHTTFRDVPVDWIGDSFIREAERLREINEAAYLHEYEGIATGTGGEVFQNIDVREITDDEINDYQYIYSGIDFGFSVDPSVYIRTAYDQKHDTIYLLDEIYLHGASNSELAAAIKRKGYDRQPGAEYLVTLGESVRRRDRIVCDCAEPKSIADLKQEGLLAVPCKKWPGSVAYGIKWLQHRKLVIDPKRTPQALKEFTGYEYLKTRDGEITANVPDKDNHLIDATRYALSALIDRKGVSA